MISFKIEKPHKANFTPSDLIYSWCKSNNLEYKITSLLTKYVTVAGNDYTYDHWTIEQKDETTDIITVYLKKF
jgi:hypothetical protein